MRKEMKAENNLGYYPAPIKIVSDNELAERLDEFFERNPMLKKAWWYRQAVIEKLERDKAMENV